MINRYLLAVLSLLLMDKSMASSPLQLEPLPTKGLAIVPLAKMNMPDELRQEILRRRSEEKKKGFYETESESGLFLLNIKSRAHDEIRFHGASNDPLNTFMHPSLSAIKLATTFNTTPVSAQNIFGYAPVGTFIQGEKSGWTGAKVFFSDKDLGTCSYAFFDLGLSNGAVQLNAETTEYLVNGKPTNKGIEGNYNSGFSYEVHWFTKNTRSELECANRTFDQEKMTALIELAKKFDLASSSKTKHKV